MSDTDLLGGDHNSPKCVNVREKRRKKGGGGGDLEGYKIVKYLERATLLGTVFL